MQYLTALHFSTALITGGEPPVAPGFWMERVFVVLMMVVSFLVCSTMLSEIVVVMSKVNQDSAELRRKIRVMKDFMTNRKVPLTLQGKIKRYLQFQHKTNQSRLLVP
jgi:hypothetical protein